MTILGLVGHGQSKTTQWNLEVVSKLLFGTLRRLRRLRASSASSSSSGVFGVFFVFGRLRASSASSVVCGVFGTNLGHLCCHQCESIIITTIVMRYHEMSWVCTSRSWHIAIPRLLLWAQQAEPLNVNIDHLQWYHMIDPDGYATNLKQPPSAVAPSGASGSWSTRLRSGRYCNVHLSRESAFVSKWRAAYDGRQPQRHKEQKKTRHHARPTLTNRDWPLCFLQFYVLQRFVGEAMLALTQGWYWLQLTAGIQLWLPYLSRSQGMWPASLEDWPEICGEVSGPADRGILPIFSA